MLMEHKSRPSRKQPLLSIIIPTYNRPESLKRCLDSLAELDMVSGGGDLEIIVVDDGSNPPCEILVPAWPAGRRCQFLRQENRGPAAARNHGAENASGRFLAFFDDDCRAPPDWFTTVARSLDERVMIGGTTRNMATGIFSDASQILVNYLYRRFNHQGERVRFLTSNNMIVPARMFREVNGFSELFPKAAAEDRDFCDRWLRVGHEIRHVPEIVVNHYHEMNIFQFIRQHFGYGFGAFLYHENRKSLTGGTLKLEPLQFYIELLLFPFSPAGKINSKLNAFFLSLCLLISQIFNCAGYVWACQKIRLAEFRC